MKKNKVNIRPFTRQFYRGNKLRFGLAIVQTILVTATNLLCSWLIQQIIDLSTGADTGYHFDEIIGLTLLCVLLLILTFLFAYLSKPRFITKGISQYKTYVFDMLSKKSISAFTGENTSVYISALSNDVNTIENGYLSNIFIIMDQSVLCVGALALMFVYSPILTLISIGLSILPLVASILTGNLVATAEKNVSDKNETYMSTLRDSLVGFSVIKTFRAEAQMCRIFSDNVKSVANAKSHRMKMSILVQMFSSTAGLILQLGVFLIGAFLSLSGMAISAGTVLVFVQLLNYVISPIGSIPQALAECKASKALITKLSLALSENVREEGSVTQQELKNGITLNHLSFHYEEGKPVLSDLCFHFAAGKSYCLVGASGCGKSTVLNLLMASRSDYSGTIHYDDFELRDISSESLYELVSLVQQNVFVFNASIRDNITMFSHFPDSEVERAIQLSGLSTLIAERGEEFQCGENGSGLSGGEKQRISIARSLLKKSQVLLVDEATAALDAQTSYQVSSSILHLQGLTRIVITHDLDAALLSKYDCILTMKNGKIIEEGTFEELLEKKGYFYSLYTVSQ